VFTHGTETLDEAGSIDAPELPKKDQGIDATTAFAGRYKHFGRVETRADG
jgi:hypothetical protein